jgi:hypothetical protein
MSVVRVYVPSSMRSLREVVDSREIGPAPIVAHAVTEALRIAYPDGGEEEWEYAAAAAAGLASIGLLSGDEPARRVVLAVDVPRVSSVDSEDPTAVRIDEATPFRRVAAVLADAAEAEPDVARARDALASGAADAEVAQERCLDHELGWWATQEIATLLEDSGRTR